MFPTERTAEAECRRFAIRLIETSLWLPNATINHAPIGTFPKMRDKNSTYGVLAQPPHKNELRPPKKYGIRSSRPERDDWSGRGRIVSVSFRSAPHPRRVAGVAKLVNARDLGSRSSVGIAGSNPAASTTLRSLSGEAAACANHSAECATLQIRLDVQSCARHTESRNLGVRAASMATYSVDSERIDTPYVKVWTLP
jgi:hypothetical protein